ncbi:manganese catalase family protein [Nocardia cyriacigeorgica]|uniref:manganese catalase family protein n=1 Tax=Nocardia cyriacigeorgica TaxID=135487 RepID=UPI001892DB80|nr:manganese catalase family protein [Nocardia cyriacigeorgica]MBF6088382.1 manganese catalase family protein [Nocardia cyriacigeorgica]MBF6095488.1 manganese catalase family protein [Nocardia cyriacigeorgica]MBF6100789.1 manganese catalase family protein [Nocardia cyriacigeorgica]MBF6161814.1 manganese catalase family protein [Nocardia cyriacigeorgica]MBF6200612.1 manganese catalase family protein [Nocardia cyriacigeorgica]
MFIHNKDLQFEVRVNEPDPRFATLLQEQFGGANGELKAAMQYFSQAFVLRRKHPKMYDLFMDIATEEFSHLEIVGSMITMLLDGLNDDLKQANERCDWMPVVGSNGGREQAIHHVAADPLFFALRGGGPDVGNSAGVPWSGSYVNSNGEPSVDLRSNLAAESRAKIVYEYLKQFTDDPGVQDTLTFLMTREVAHFQQFTAALNELPVNFPPGAQPGDDRFQNLAFNMSDGDSSRGPWNEGQGPWPQGVEWEYVEDPVRDWLGTSQRDNQGPTANPEGSPAIAGTKPFTHEQHMPT